MGFADLVLRIVAIPLVPQRTKKVNPVLKKGGMNENRSGTGRGSCVAEPSNGMQNPLQIDTPTQARYLFPVQAGWDLIDEPTHVRPVVRPRSVPTNEVLEGWFHLRQF